MTNEPMNQTKNAKLVAEALRWESYRANGMTRDECLTAEAIFYLDSDTNEQQRTDAKFPTKNKSTR